MDLSNILETVKEDDYVEYYLFPYINDDTNEECQQTFLNNCLTETNRIVEQYTKNYIWHKDKFNLVPKSKNNQILNTDDSDTEYIPPHLYGILHFGDNIEDEWFLVFLLLKLSEEIEGLIIRVVDADGEFLLIEAANHLPSWANPETCEKRVYLYQGNLHLIPLQGSQINVTDALRTIREKSLLTEASSNIQKSIQDRTAGYPNKIKDLLHRTKVYVPIGVAAILNHEPNLIAPAILAFANRDPIDMKACRAMKYFPPENRVYTSVVFTKCLYAMLCHSNYNPDRRTGWNLPKVNTEEFKSHSLGVKIACGFEILATQAKIPDLECDKLWIKYLDSLKQKQYFKDLLEGSQEYNNLLNKAKDYFREQQLTDRSTAQVGHHILELNRKLDYTVDDFSNEGDSSLLEDNDDSWLNITPQDLDQMLTERFGMNCTRINGTNATNLTGKLTEFLNHVSDVDGAEFPGTVGNKDFDEISTYDNGNTTTSQFTEFLNGVDGPPVRPKRGVKRTKPIAETSGNNAQTNVESDNSKINFDPSTFSCAVQNILDLVIPEDSWDLESGSEMSEYEDETGLDLEHMDSAKIKEYMNEMDRELAGTTVGQSFERKPVEDDSFDDIETFQPVDIDMTALKNILESYQSQLGAAGPASNMLGPMGLHLDPCSSQDLNDE